mgnify:FL=1
MKKLIAGNWKMNLDIGEAVKLIDQLTAELNDYDFEKADILVCPNFTCLYPVHELLKDSQILLGAQNMYHETEGAYTGETSGSMLKAVGCSYVILGHSERRKYFGETDEFINLKISKAQSYDLIPILCVGESLEERESDRHFEVVKSQLLKSLSGLDKDEVLKTTVAYEPVWAIGTGKNATSSEAQEMHKFIRDEVISGIVGDGSKSIRILYGGSLNENVSAEQLSQPDIDGGLIGGARLKFGSFTKIIR